MTLFKLVNSTVSGKIGSIRSNRFCIHQTPRSARYKLQRLPDSFLMRPLPSSVLSNLLGTVPTSLPSCGPTCKMLSSSVIQTLSSQRSRFA